jgi:hypothetical protein
MAAVGYLHVKELSTNWPAGSTCAQMTRGRAVGRASS